MVSNYNNESDDELCFAAKSQLLQNSFDTDSEVMGASQAAEFCVQYGLENVVDHANFLNKVSFIPNWALYLMR